MLGWIVIGVVTLFVFLLSMASISLAAALFQIGSTLPDSLLDVSFDDEDL